MDRPEPPTPPAKLANPFALCTWEHMIAVLTRLCRCAPAAQEVESVHAAYLVAELAKWLIAHGEENEEGHFRICITLGNPHKLAPEQLALQAMRKSPL